MKKAGELVKRWAPVVAVLFLSAQEIASTLGQSDVAAVASLGMKALGLEVDRETLPLIAGVVAGVGALYKLAKRLALYVTPPAGNVN